MKEIVILTTDLSASQFAQQIVTHGLLGGASLGAKVNGPMKVFPSTNVPDRDSVFKNMGSSGKFQRSVLPSLVTNKNKTTRMSQDV